MNIKERIQNTAIYTTAVLIAVLLPIFLSLPPFSTFVGSTYGDQTRIFEFFGLSGFLAVSVLVAWYIKRYHPSTLEGYLKILLPAVVALVWLNFLSENFQKSWDYQCYESAAKAFLEGNNPYLGCYLYPPFVLSVFSWAYQIIQYAVTILRGFPVHDEKAWLLIFYFFQCAQWLMVVLAYILSSNLAEKYGLEKKLVMGIVSLLFILNNPLLRTLRHNQVNVWVLNTILAVLLTYPVRPFVSGLMAAVGAHIKLYPVLFIAPFGLLKNKRALSGFVVGVVVLFILTIILGHDGTWLQFIHSFTKPPQGIMLRDNSIHSLVFNVLRITSIIQPGDRDNQVLKGISITLTFLAGIWVLARLVARLRNLTKNAGGSLERDGLFVDITGLMLLVSPMVWEHHYVLAIPLMLWTFAYQIKEKQFPVASLLAFLFIFGLPTFDVFPFSYLRLAGLLILLIKSDPIHAFQRITRMAALKGL